MRFTNNNDTFKRGSISNAFDLLFDGSTAPFGSNWDWALLSGREERFFAVPMGEGWTDSALHLRFSIPGVPKNQFTLTAQGDRLVLRGKRERPDMLDSFGIPYGKFERVLELSPALDTERMRASLHDGVLDVEIPLRDSAKRVEIPINAMAEETQPV